MNTNFISRMACLSKKSKKAALLLALGFVALAAGSAQAAVHTWDGGHASGRWDHASNWDTPSPTVPIVDNTADIKIAGTVELDQYLRKDTTIKSLEFMSSNTGATQIGLVAGNGTTARHLTFSADSGNSSLTVDASASGDKTLGTWGGVVSPGVVTLSSDLDITHNGSGNVIFATGIEGGSRNISLTGSGTTVFSGTNTYTGNTTVNGVLTLSDDAQLAFTIGTNGVNNVLSGSGTVVLDGDFLIDLAGAGTTLGDSWQLVDVGTLTETFGTTFSLASAAGSFTETNGVWSIIENGAAYAFAESNGLLTVVGDLPAAYWMSGEWGIGWRFRADNKTEIDNWDVDTLVSQVKTIPGVKYVVFNLSDAAHGDAYIAPHSVLSVITTNSTPNGGLAGRDLFMEMAQGFQTNGIKVFAYLACQGPAMLKHGAESAFDSVDEGGGVFSSVAMDNWSNYVHGVYGNTTVDTYKQAFGEVILDEYAERYGTLIDGWWFDNGIDNFDTELLFSIVKQHNSNVVVAAGTNPSLQSDLLSGHPTPLAQYPANDLINLPMLTNIELSDGGYVYTNAHPNLGHMFMAVGEKWNSGSIVWELDQAADWMERCIKAGGAWTWNVDLTDSSSIIRADMAAFITNVVAEMSKPNVAPIFAVDPMVGGNATSDVAYADSIFGSATDGDGDSLSYTKLDGPAWLNIATNGILSGTPTSSDGGLNSFQIGAGDGKGENTIATLEISVAEPVYGKFITVDDFPVFNLTAHTNTVKGSNQRLRATGSLTTSPGQTFTIPAGTTTTVSRLSVLNKNSESFDTNSTHEIQLWLGEYTNNTPGAAYAVELFDMADESIGASTYITFDLSSDVTLTPGEYAFQLAWTTTNANHDMILHYNGSGSDYSGGARLNATATTNIPTALPFTDTAVAGSGLTFAIHSRTDAEWVDMGGVFPTGDDIVASMSANSNLSTLVRNVSGTGSRISGQSFDLAEETTLSAITIQNKDAESFNGANKHELDLWIVELDDGLSNNVPLWVDAVSLSSKTMMNDNFYQIDFTDITLPAGSYGIEVEWARESSNHQLNWMTSGSVDEYADGYLLAKTGLGANAPFDGTVGTKDLVFALHKLVAEAGFATWIAGYGLSGDDLLPGTDVEPDGLDNLMEYTLGGNPTLDDFAGVSPATYSAEDGGTNWFYHVYDKRVDDAALTFALGATDDLVGTPADTNDVEFVGQSAEFGGFRTQTNRTEASSDAKFIQLDVQKD